MAINLLGNTNVNSSNVLNSLMSGSSINVQQTDAEAAKVLLSQIKEMLPGQIIDGKLLEIDGSNAKLLLNNNLILNTQIQSGANLNAGQNLSFEIQSNSGKQLLIRPLHTNLSADSTAVKALESASVKVSEETIKMVDTLMKEGMPINKDTLNSINRELNAYPKADVETIVLLNKFNMPVNETNIEQMTMYRNNNSQMMANIDTLAQNLTEAIIDYVTSDGVDVSSFLNELENALSLKEETGDTVNRESLQGDSKAATTNEDLTSSKALDLLNKLKNMTPEKMAQPSIAKHIKNDLADILGKKFLMEPSEIADKENVKKYYSRTLETANKLENILSSENRMSDNSSALKDVTNIKNNISFMNDINEMFNYIQLPLQMADGQANGDLYVYRRNSKAGNIQEDGPLTALLHLSMETLGNMDIFLKLDNNYLSTKFCLEKEEMIDFIESHIESLNAKLIDKGYNIDTSVGKIEDKEKNVIDLIQGKKEEITILSSQTFDARA